MEKYTKSVSYKMFHLCIDEIKDCLMSGVVYNNTVEEPLCFTDIHDLVLSVDKIFDKNGNPQSSQMKRSFQKKEKVYEFQSKPEVYCDYNEFLDKKGKVATFDILVQTRRQSTWQGIIFYQDDEIKFENILDFIRKISFFLSV